MKTIKLGQREPVGENPPQSMVNSILATALMAKRMLPPYWHSCSMSLMGVMEDRRGATYYCL